MPGRISIILLIEMILVVSTTILLAQPKFLFRASSDTVKSVAQWGGMLLLCATFCWSVIVGIAVTMNGLILSL